VSCPAVARKGESVSRSDDDRADRTFSRASRLRARKHFLEVYERGQRMPSAFFVLFGLPGATPISRLGITATKRFGGAVARNRIKRVVREIFRNNKIPDSFPIDLVVNVKMSAREQSYDRLEADFASRLREMQRRLIA
jgi:ribonuclease P protein component